MSVSMAATALHITPSEFKQPQTFMSCPSMAGWVFLKGFKKLSLLSQVTKMEKAETGLHSVSRPLKHVCRAAAEYKFPDPIPDFAEAEIEKFRTHLLSKLSKKDIYEDSAEEVVGICTEIFSNFLHTEYGGPGTLLVVPFIDMAETVHERGLPGASQAARVAVKWATAHVDKDWKEWTGTD